MDLDRGEAWEAEEGSFASSKVLVQMAGKWSMEGQDQQARPLSYTEGRGVSHQELQDAVNRRGMG
jgi:hypothetical protein